MKLKRLIKFYFHADELNSWLDRLLEYKACFPCSAEPCGDFDRVFEIIGDKVSLGKLYSYLKVIMDGLTEGDRAVLNRYSHLRTDIKRLGGDEYREFKRTAMKFSRRLRYIGAYAAEVGVLGKYRALI